MNSLALKRWPFRKFGACGDFLSGGTPDRSRPDYWDGTIPWISAKSLKSFDVAHSDDRLTGAGVRAGSRLVSAGTLLFVVRGISLANEFRVGISGSRILSLVDHFLDFFGDPAINPKRWPRKAIGARAIKFSDGPFGSNLKSSHYTASGVRVIRLQNIGVDEFIDDDKAYISDEHFAALSKHACRPGDVLVGTLGDPNLRACIQPTWLAVALNKADCVQLRPDPRVGNAAYLCALLNQPATERMARALIAGQTRLRISMGRLRDLEVQVPPLELQDEFSRRIDRVNKLKSDAASSLAEFDALFASLQHRAFRGEL